MILTTHALVGAALGKHVTNPWLLTIIALPLHYFLDTFRHGEYLNQKSTFKNTWWKVALDLLTAISAVFAYLLWAHPTQAATKNILWGAFISMFPDLLTVLYWKLNFSFLQKLYVFHTRVHKYPQGAKEREWNWANATNDIIFSAIAIIILILL